MPAPTSLSLLRTPGRFFLAAIVTVGLLVGAAGTASATTPAATESAVGASTLAPASLVGLSGHVSPVRHLESYDSQAEIVSATGVAANTAETVAVNGETVAITFGRQMHATWDYGPGFSPEFTLKAGGRADGINFGTRELIELKPNNPRAIRLGNQQLEGYIAKLNEQFPGEPWTGRVVTYDR